MLLPALMQKAYSIALHQRLKCGMRKFVGFRSGTIYTFEKNVGEAKPQNISEVMDALNLMLQNIGVSMENFCQIVAGVT
jgi:hypothetical protein